MPRILSPAQVEQYRTDGFAFPVPVLSADEVRDLRADLEAWERRQGHPLDFPEKSKSYLLYKWADTLVHHPKVLDAVEDVIGPNILVYHSTMWIKEAHTPAYVRWHQDGAYWGLEPMEVLTAWVALGPATRANGCMRVLPGSHRGPALKQRDTFAPDNALSRGQEIEVAVDEAQAVDLALEPGQMSMHHLWIVHGSDPNRSAVPRVGLAIRYVAAQVRQRDGSRPLAMLVRGQNRHGHFTLAEQPTRNDGRAGEGVHGQVLQRVREAIEQARPWPA